MGCGFGKALDGAQWFDSINGRGRFDPYPAAHQINRQQWHNEGEKKMKYIKIETSEYSEDFDNKVAALIKENFPDLKQVRGGDGTLYFGDGSEPSSLVGNAA